MGDSPTNPVPDGDPDLADPAWLFRDAPTAENNPPQRPVVPSGSDEGFDLADSPTPPPKVRTPVREAKAATTGPSAASATPRASRRIESASPVDQVWSRGAEWGTTLAILGLWTALIVFLLFLAIGGEFYSLAMLLLLAGAVVGLVLSYPIVITLERPVRTTPELAARDYYGALSHHRPHYRRMWLLLSNAGRTSSRFASFEGFQKYWADRIKTLRQGRPGASAPLTFLVSEFKAEKCAGKTAIHGEWKVNVFIRGRREQGPIWSLPVASNFSKGPDGMWYLDDGTLAERRSGG